jgi:Domain of unknown function (DUF4331)
MIQINKMSIIAIAIAAITIISCKKKDDEVPPPVDTFDTSGTFTQNDQMARPAINTVFVGAARKNEFNTTTPSAMSAAFKTDFVNVLTGFGYTTNILMLSKDAFASTLVTDVLGVSLNSATNFGTLSGRALTNDVIDTELTLIFGGLSGSSNPGLISDNVSANDKTFLTSFPYLASPF